MNKHVNKVRKATGRAEATTAGRQQNKQTSWSAWSDVIFRVTMFSWLSPFIKRCFVSDLACQQ